MLINAIPAPPKPAQGYSARANVLCQLPGEAAWYGATLDRKRRRLICFGDKWVVVDLNSGKIIQTLSRSVMPLGPMRPMNGGRDWIWLSDWGTVFQTNQSTLKSVALTQVSEPSKPFDYDEASHTVYFGSGSSVYAWRIGSRTLRHIASTGGDWGYIGGQLNPAHDMLAVTQYSVSLLSLGKRTHRFDLQGPGDSWQTSEPTFSPNGRQVAAGTSSGVLEVWSTRSRKNRMATRVGRSVKAIHWFGDVVAVAAIRNWRLKQPGPDLVAVYRPPNPKAIAVDWVPDMSFKWIDWLGPNSLIALTEQGRVYLLTTHRDNRTSSVWGQHEIPRRRPSRPVG